MVRLTLRYAEDPTTGLPRLEAQGGSLSAGELEMVGNAIDRHFESLTSGPDGQILELNGSAGPGLPRQFRVTVAEREKRCPTLLLEAVDPPTVADPQPSSADSPPETVPAPPGRWQGQFVAEAAELIAGLGGDGSRSPLDFVLADLRALLRKDPSRFTLLLFAGYLHVGDALSLRHGESADNPYARGAWALLQRAGASLPEGALDPLLPQRERATSDPAAEQPEEPTGWLRGFFSLS